MSNKVDGHSNSNGIQPIVLGIGALLALVMIFSFFSSPSTEPAAAAAPVVAATTDENIKPVAAVAMAEAEGAHVDKSGEEVVKAGCAMCHDAGLMGAPKIGDKEAWKPRIAQGYDMLVKNAINGVRTMPAKGGNPALTDGEIANAVAHMANLSGADFKAPAANSTEATAADAAPAEAVAAVEAAPVVEQVAVAAVATAAVVAVMPKKAEVKAVETKVAEMKVAEAKVEAPAPVEAAPAPVEEKKAEAAPAGKSGKEVYTASCAMCHASGMMNAPKFGDKGMWEPRIAQGYDTLVKHANNGIRTMPAKGGNSSLSDDEVAAAVKYMANEAGAGF